jgi:transcription elongation factor
MSKTSRMNKAAKERDKQAAQGGQAAGGSNGTGGQKPMQKSGGNRTASNRDAQLGGGRQPQPEDGGHGD